MLTITFLGNAAVAIDDGDAGVLVDPYLADSDEWPGDLDAALDAVGAVDGVLVTHAADDHLGDAPALALEHGLPVVSEPATTHALEAAGVPAEQLSTVVWGQTVDVAGLTVRVLEARHASSTVVDGRLVSGQPASFLVSSGGTSVYHMGDTSIHRDLELFGELYDPDVALLGVGQAYPGEDEATPFGRNIAELTTDEAVLAARWVGADTVVPMHYLPAERERFLEAIAADPDVPETVPLDPGESITVA